MWDNEDWANNHIKKKRKITPLEAWEVVFESDPPTSPYDISSSTELPTLHSLLGDRRSE